MLLNNRYRIIHTLGRGGFGETFLAEDTQMPSNRRCVIKQLKPIQNNPQIYQLVQQRFQREAAILEELGDGSNQIPRLYAYFSENSQFYLVQEYIEGQTLSSKLQQQGALSESSVKEILTHILPVLNYIHSKGIVHRDIKPDNILIRYTDSKPVLIDFGAVKETVGTVLTPSGNSAKSIVIGTPGFMPNEQSIGRPLFASDIYSLGLTAIYLLTGKMPQELATDPSSGAIFWRNYANSITPSFAAVLDKAIQFNPSDRYSNAREMLEALQFEAFPLPPTIPYPPTGVAAQPTVLSPQNTMPVSPGTSPQPSVQGPGQRRIFLGSLIAGTVIGASIIIGLVALNKAPQSEPTTASIETKVSSHAQPTVASLEPKNTEPQNTTSPTQSFNVSATPSSSQTPSSQLFSSTPLPVDRPSPTQAVQNYFLTINQGQYQVAWKQLSPNYQNNKRLHPNGYLSYIDWWGGQVQNVELEQVDLVKSNTETATVYAQLKYLLKTGKIITNSVRFSLLWDAENNRWVIYDTK
jgi:serine/threonine-protein kinase